VATSPRCYHRPSSFSFSLSSSSIVVIIIHRHSCSCHSRHRPSSFSVTHYKFKVSPGTLVFVCEGLYQFLRYFYSTFPRHFLGLVPALPFPIPRTWVSSGFFEYVSQWRGDDPAACTIAFHTTGGMICPVGLDIIAPEPIEISYILHYIILKVFLVSGSTHVLLILYELTPLNPPLHLSMKGRNLNDEDK